MARRRHTPEQIITALREAEADDLLDRMLYADCKVRLPNHSVMILDRTTMAYGLEARAPFLDHELAEFCATIPVSLKVNGRSLRYIQKELARRYLPDNVIGRPKQGFSSAPPYLLRDELAFLFRNFLSRSRSRMVEAGYLEPAAIESMVEEHLGGKRDHGNRLWLLVNSELWYRMHIEGISLEEMSAELQGEEAPVAKT